MATPLSGEFRKALTADIAQTQGTISQISSQPGVPTAAMAPIQARSIVVGRKRSLERELRNFRSAQDKAINDLTFKAGLNNIQAERIFKTNLNAKLNEIAMAAQRRSFELARKAQDQQLNRQKKKALGKTFGSIFGTIVGAIVGTIAAPGPGTVAGASLGGAAGGSIGGAVETL